MLNSGRGRKCLTISHPIWAGIMCIPESRIMDVTTPQASETGQAAPPDRSGEAILMSLGSDPQAGQVVIGWPWERLQAGICISSMF